MTIRLSSGTEAGRVTFPASKVSIGGSFSAYTEIDNTVFSNLITDIYTDRPVKSLLLDYPESYLNGLHLENKNQISLGDGLYHTQYGNLFYIKDGYRDVIINPFNNQRRLELKYKDSKVTTLSFADYLVSVVNTMIEDMNNNVKVRYRRDFFGVMFADQHRITSSTSVLMTDMANEWAMAIFHRSNLRGSIIPAVNELIQWYTTNSHNTESMWNSDAEYRDDDMLHTMPMTTPPVDKVVECIEVEVKSDDSNIRSISCSEIRHANLGTALATYRQLFLELGIDVSSITHLKNSKCTLDLYVSESNIMATSPGGKSNMITRHSSYYKLHHLNGTVNGKGLFHLRMDFGTNNLETCFVSKKALESGDGVRLLNGVVLHDRKVINPISNGIGDTLGAVVVHNGLDVVNMYTISFGAVTKIPEEINVGVTSPKVELRGMVDGVRVGEVVQVAYYAEHLIYGSLSEAESALLNKDNVNVVRAKTLEVVSNERIKTAQIKTEQATIALESEKSKQEHEFRKQVVELGALLKALDDKMKISMNDVEISGHKVIISQHAKKVAEYNRETNELKMATAAASEVKSGLTTIGSIFKSAIGFF